MKGIRVADLQACKCFFPGQRSDTFRTGHVCGYCLMDTIIHCKLTFNIYVMLWTFS